MKHLTTSDLKYLLTLVEKEADHGRNISHAYMSGLMVRLEDEVLFENRKQKEATPIPSIYIDNCPEMCLCTQCYPEQFDK
jgi:hypothetical protein